MESLKQQRTYGKAKTMRRRLMGAGLLTAALAGLILIIPTGSDYTASQREAASNGITEELVITEIAQSTGGAPVLVSLEEEPTGELALGFSPSGTPEYVTTQVPYIEIPSPVLLADNRMPSAPPANIGDVDAQPAVQAPGPRAPAIAGVPGGTGGPNGSGPQGPGPSLGGGAPGGGSSPGNPSSPSTSGPSSPPSDPTPGDNGPMVAGPTATPPATTNPGPQTASVPNAPANPPANNQPGPAALPDELTGPVVGANDDPKDDWLSPGHSPGIMEVDNFTLSGQTLLFEIFGPKPDEPDIQYDQLIVTGDVILDSGNIVFAFINGYDPVIDPNALFNLIVAGEIYGTDADGKEIANDQDFDGVNFYYGFFDKSYPEHAPYDLSEYFVWTADSRIQRDFIYGTDTRDLLQISYKDPTPKDATEGPKQRFDPVDIGAEIPAPAPLLLLATGLLLAGSFRRRV